MALVVLRKDAEHYRAKYGTSDYGGVKLSLLLEKQHNRGQDGAGAAIIAANPVPGAAPYQMFKSASATPLADVLGMMTRRDTSRRDAEGQRERVFLGHLRYATFGKNEEAFCHPFVHTASELGKTLLLAGNFNLTNAADLFESFRRRNCFPASRADGYLITELIAHELESGGTQFTASFPGADAINRVPPVASALANALKDADGAWTLIGATADGEVFATRDPHGIRPGWYYANDEVVVVASERAAIQAAFDVLPEDVKELPRGEAMIVSPEGDMQFVRISEPREGKACVFERIYFSRANDADIHRERKALGAALVPSVLKAADAPIERIFFSYIPNSARIAFHGLLEKLFHLVLRRDAEEQGIEINGNALCDPASLRETTFPRFGEIAVKDAKFRTFIADAAARREFYKHVYDVTYGLVGKDDTLVVLDDSIVRGNTMKNAILPMLSRLGPRHIVVASSAPPIRYPDCYGIDMSTLGELVAFRALVNLLGEGANDILRDALKSDAPNPLAPLYARFTDEQHTAEIARLLTPPDIKLRVSVVFQTVDNLRKCILPHPAPSQLSTFNSQLSLGDWYFTGNYPTPGGYKVLRKALANYLSKNSERSY